MRKPADILPTLLALFEESMHRVIEGRRRRWRAALAGEAPSGRRVRGSLPFRRFKRGELTFERFLCAKVERALQPLSHLLDESDIAFLRERGRELFEDDQVLAELGAHLASFGPKDMARPHGSAKRSREG